jgi:uncharacterized iron-regulated membrane protein
MAFAEQFVRRPQSVWLRKAIFQIHLWTGIAMGLYVVAISVSGSALFFRSAVNEATPGRKIVAGSGRLLTNAELVEAARRAYPEYTPRNVSAGTTPGLEVEITLERGAKRKVRIFDPYTGRDLGEAVPYSLQIMSWMLNLHVNLLAGPTGRIVNGVCAILLTLLSVTGAVIWWPGIRNWRRSLTVNPRANWKRMNWDLHSAVGFWTFAFFFMWSFTGIYLVFPAPFEIFINRVAPLDYYRLVSQDSEPSLQFAKIGSATVLIRVADTAPGNKAKRRRPAIHYSGGDQIIRAFMSLHFGNFAGLKTRIVWAVIGLAPPFLFITGALMWWNRVLSREGRRLRRDSATARALDAATADSGPAGAAVL